MHFDVISLFPEMFAAVQQEGVVGKAWQQELWTMRVHNPRQFAQNRYGHIDDRPYGGGAGMVMAYEPLVQTLNAIEGVEDKRVVMLSPHGASFSQQKVESLRKNPALVLVCGRYEGVDQRFVDHHVDEQISLGDFVLSGGELAAMCMIDALVRWQPKVLGNANSASDDSFSQHHEGLLDCPHYTRPDVVALQKPRYMRQIQAAAPSVLLGGDHQAIAEWRRWQRLALTAEKRPELLSVALQEELRVLVKKFAEKGV